MQFPNLKVGRSTIHNVFKKLLRYSYKRITKQRHKNRLNPINKIKKIIFMKKFLKRLKKKKNKLIIIDEAGFGTAVLRRYGYAKIGK